MSPNVRCPLCLTWHTPQCRATPPDTRWPLQPLADAVGGRAELADRIDSGNVSIGMRDGLSDHQADQWAVRLGYHPEQIWPGWCETALTYTDAAAIEGSRRVWLWRETQRTQPAHAPTQHLRRSA